MRYMENIVRVQSTGAVRYSILTIPSPTRPSGKPTTQGLISLLLASQSHPSSPYFFAFPELSLEVLIPISLPPLEYLIPPHMSPLLPIRAQYSASRPVPHRRLCGSHILETTGFHYNDTLHIFFTFFFTFF